jgi:hypothetical protein
MIRDGLTYELEVVSAPKRSSHDAHGTWTRGATVSIVCARCARPAFVQVAADALQRLDPYNNQCLTTLPDGYRMFIEFTIAIGELAEHVCLPPTLQPKFEGRVRWASSKHEQYECMSTVFAELAQEAE